MYANATELLFFHISFLHKYTQLPSIINVLTEYGKPTLYMVIEKLTLSQIFDEKITKSVAP
jgi:hypothetical protein